VARWAAVLDELEGRALFEARTQGSDALVTEAVERYAVADTAVSARSPMGPRARGVRLLEVHQGRAVLERRGKWAGAGSTQAIVVETRENRPSMQSGLRFCVQDMHTYERRRIVGQVRSAPASTVTPSSPRLQLLSLDSATQSQSGRSQYTPTDVQQVLQGRELFECCRQNTGAVSAKLVVGQTGGEHCESAAHSHVRRGLRTGT
jgi:hypothetical protein